MTARLPRVLIITACALTASASAAGAASSRVQTLPLQGSSSGNFGLVRGDFRYGPHAHVKRPTATTSVPWTQPGSFAVAVVRRQIKARTITAFGFTANQNNPPLPLTDGKLSFASPVATPKEPGYPMALTQSFGHTEMCSKLPKGTLKASQFAVLVSGGTALGSLSPADEVAQGLNIVCKRSSGAPLRAALGAG